MPRANPTSTGLAVTANLTSIGGLANQQFFNDGTHGDVTANDNIFSFQATVPAATSTGGKTILATITDAQGRSGSAPISLTVTAASTPPTGTGSANPGSVQAGNATLLAVSVTPGANPTSTGITVAADLSSIGGSASQQFSDNGNNTFSFQATVSAGTSAGAKSLPFTVADAQGRSSTSVISLSVQSPPPPTTVKISQVYGGGGNSGSTYTNDFIELYNSGSTPVQLDGWSVQETSATGTSWIVNGPPTLLSGAIQPGHYYLVQESAQGGGTTGLPNADATGAINLGATNGKVALVATTATLSGGCPLGGLVVDFVGYGSANCSEGNAAAAALSSTAAAVRRGNGCADTDNNANDFVTSGPIPRNSSSPVNSCGGDPTQPSGLGVASPASLDPASNTLLTVRVTPATAPPSTDISVNGDLTSIGGAASQQFYDDGTHGDVAAGDNVFSFQATVAPGITTGAKNIVATITDAQARIATAPVTLTVQSPTCGIERWSVKVGTDPDVHLVNLNNPVRTTIAELGALTPPPDPPGPPSDARVPPTEATVYVIDATMTLYKKEADVDYHVVLQDNSGHTMVAEIPSPACIIAQNPNGPGRVLVPSPLQQGIANSRAKFDARFTATTFFQTANVPVRVTGVGFFDFIHGQSGVAPNGIELHPILDIAFTANTTTTLMSPANPSQYGQQVAITATVTNGGVAGTPTGNVTFFDGGSPVDVVVLDQSGQATFRTSTLSVGSHSITASYEGDNASAPSTTAAALAQVVNKADQTIDFAPLAGKTYGDADFNVTVTASSSLPVSLEIFSGPATISGSTVRITGTGAVTVRASQAGDGNYNAAPATDRSFVVAKAGQTINFAALPDKTYGDAPFTVSAVGGGSANPVSFSAGGNCTSGGANGSEITITGAGSCAVTASQGGDANYNAAADVSQTFAVSKAGSTTTVTVGDATYDGNPHGGIAVATGAGGLSQSLTVTYSGRNATAYGPSATPPTNAGDYAASANFGGDANHDASSGSEFFQIAKATATISLGDLTQTYNGSPRPATATTTPGGLGGVTITYNNSPNAPTNAGSYALVASLNNQNYEANDATGTLTVSKAAPFVSAAGNTCTYSGGPCAGGGSATGVDGSDLGAVTLTYSPGVNAPVNAGSYTVVASIGETANHTAGSSAPATVTIGQAAPTVSVSVPGVAVTYDGHAHPATGFAYGVGGISDVLSPAVTFTYNGSVVEPVNADIYAVVASFAGNDNYLPATNSSASILISRAAATINVNGYTGVYDGQAHGANGSATGVGGENLTGLLNLGESFTDAPGGTANWSFAGDANYKAATGTVIIVITRATPTVSWNNPADITYGTALGAAQLSATASVQGNFVYTPAAGTILNAGNGQTLSVSFVPTDATNYNNASASASINVLKATPTVSATGGTFMYDGAAHTATGSVVGVGSPGENLGAPDFTYNGGTAAPVNAGTYNVIASFAGNSNYNPASNTATVTINKATPALTWNNPADITYGTPLSSTQLNASANVPGTFTYTPAQGAMLSAGSAQTLLASFAPADTANYSPTTKIVTINVLKATPAFGNLSSPVIGCGTATVNLSGRITFGPLIPTGGVAVTLNGVTRNAAVQSDGSFSVAFATGSLIPANSPLGVAYGYGGDANFNPVGGAGTLVVVDSVLPDMTLNNLTLFFNSLTVAFTDHTITINGTTHPFNGVSFTDDDGRTFSFNGQTVTVTMSGHTYTYTFSGKALVLWTPTHQYQAVKVADLVASADDGCDASVNLSSVVISQVTSDEGTRSSGDIIIAADCKSVQLRADRNGNGDGRVYTITFRVRDASGNTTTKAAKIAIPRGQGSAVDSGPAYTVTSGCP
jgi:hypothetical protein